MYCKKMNGSLPEVTELLPARPGKSAEYTDGKRKVRLRIRLFAAMRMKGPDGGRSIMVM